MSFNWTPVGPDDVDIDQSNDFDDELAQLPLKGDIDAERQVRRRSSKACDQCRKSKCKCERPSPDEPCRNCILLGTQCTFLGPSRKRGPPKGYIDAIETRLHQAEALIGIILSTTDDRATALVDDLVRIDPLARDIFERIDDSQYGRRGRRRRAGLEPLATLSGRAPLGRFDPPPPPKSGSYSSTPTNEWQDQVVSRLAEYRPPSEDGHYTDERGQPVRQRRRITPPPDTKQQQLSADDVAEGIGHISLNEDEQVRYHGGTSGLSHLASRPTERNKGGIWHFPKARVWPPLPSSSPETDRDEPTVTTSLSSNNYGLPDREEQAMLLDLYFAHVHPAFPLLHKAVFQSEYNSGNATSRHISPLLLLSIFSIAARYALHGAHVNPPLPVLSSEMWPAGDQYLASAKVLLDRTYASSRLTTVQSLLLLSFREIGIGAMAQGWLYLGMAVRMAQDLGLHRAADRWVRTGHPLFTSDELETRRRVWSACVVMDKYVSTYIGRPLAIREETDADTKLPDESDSAPEEHEPLARSTDQLDAPTSKTPGHVISCFNAATCLSGIVSSIVDQVYAPRTTPAARLAASKEIELRLERWHVDLPAHLRVDNSAAAAASSPSATADAPSATPPNMTAHPHVLTLHMQYWTAVLLLHRPFITPKDSSEGGRSSPASMATAGGSSKAFDLCTTAAGHISTLASVYSVTNCLKRGPVFLTFYVFSAAIMHVNVLSRSAQNSQARKGLKHCMDVLKSMEVVWPSAARAWELLNGASYPQQSTPHINGNVPTNPALATLAYPVLPPISTSMALPRLPTSSTRHGHGAHKRSVDERDEDLRLHIPDLDHGAHRLNSAGGYSSSNGNGESNGVGLSPASPFNLLPPQNSVPTPQNSSGGFVWPALYSTSSVLPPQYSTGLDPHSHPTPSASPVQPTPIRSQQAQHASGAARGVPQYWGESFGDLGGDGGLMNYPIGGSTTNGNGQPVENGQRYLDGHYHQPMFDLAARSSS